jgi:hypothetical protein
MLLKFCTLTTEYPKILEILSNEYAMTVKPERVFEELQGYVKQGKSLGRVVFWAFILPKGGEKSDKEI